MESKTLHLTLKKKWFDMILSGEKKEEYRDIKEYWVKRFIDKNFQWDCKDAMAIQGHANAVPYNALYNHFNTITFKNGYSTNAPEMVVKFYGFSLGNGKKEWGAEQYETYFILRIGEILSARNLNQYKLC